ncbi:MAG TPA: hypothetical protein DEP53_06650 [Bacteroidetes bacterium]|nr:hypothetical protein [Bacteroidota bacterium]
MKLRASLFYLIIAVLLTHGAVWSQQYVWRGGTSGSWIDQTQWTPNRSTPTVNDTIVISGTTALISDLPTRRVRQILISGNARVTLSAFGNATLTVTGAGGVGVVVTAGSSLTLGPGVTLRCVGSIANNGGILGEGTLQCEGNVSGSADYTANVVFSGAGSRTLETTMNIVGNAIVNPGTILTGGHEGVAMNLKGTLINNGSIREREGELTINVDGSIVNNGTWANTATNLLGTGTASGTDALNTSLKVGSSGDVSVTSSITSYGDITVAAGGVVTISAGATLFAYGNVSVTRQYAGAKTAENRSPRLERSPALTFGKIEGPGYLRFRGYYKTFNNESVVEAPTVFESNQGDVKSIVGTGGEYKSLTIARGCTARFNGYHVLTGAPDPLIVHGIVTSSVNNTLSYEGTAAQTLCPVTYRRLNISNPNGVVMPAGITILESVDITRGNLVTGSDTLTLSSFAKINEGEGSVVGYLRASRACTTGVNQDFGGLGIEINPQGYTPYPAKGQSMPAPAALPAVFMVSVVRVTGIAPNMRGAAFLKKSFALAAGGDGLNARVVFRYRHDELDGTTESNLQMYGSTNGGITWISMGGIADTIANSLTISRANSLDFLSAGHPGLAPPVLASVSPRFGGLGENIIMTLTGENFSGRTNIVDFSGAGITVNSVAIASATQLTVDVTIADGSAIGLRDVTVTTPGGNATRRRGFEVQRPAPALRQMIPPEGKKGEAIAVNVSGTGFVNGLTSISFGEGISVLSFDANSTSLRAQILISRLAAAGPRDVTVVTPPPGGGSATLTGGFTVVNPTPGITSISPSSATKGKTVTVLIAGSDFFTGVTSLSLGTGIIVDSIEVLNDKSLRARVSPVYEGAANGPRDVSVSNLAPGGGVALLSGAFSVTNPEPTLTSVAPVSVSRGSLANVTVLGTQFISGVTTVSFGSDIIVTNTSVKSPTEMLVSISISSAATAGTRAVTVANAAPEGGTATLLTGFSVNSGPATGIEGNLGVVPDEYVLQEAYPNPFNPSTRIRYGIPEDSRVELVIHNMLGNVVAQLIHGERSKGLYELLWHAENLPSGVYLIRLQAESVESTKRFLASRKVVLVK